MKCLISPSLLSADFSCLGTVLKELEKAGISWVHLDIMDGSFVPNITYGPPILHSIRPCSGLFFDTHLMIDDPGRYIEAFCRAGADLLVPHLEAMIHPQRVLAKIRESGMKTGIALDPDTDPERLRWLLPYLDLVLIMGVNPGFSGQKFIPETTKRVARCREFLDYLGYNNIPIQVDGGVSVANIAELASAGASIFVSGSAFFRNDDLKQGLEAFDRALAPISAPESAARALDYADTWKSRGNLLS